MHLSKTKWIAIGATAGCLLLTALLLTAVGCRGKGDSGGPSSATSAPASSDGSTSQAAAAGPPVAVIEVVERHTDSFPASVGELTDAPFDPPFTIEEGGLCLLDSIAGETDPAKLQAHRLTLGSPGVPLAKCRVLLIYTTHYAGAGRNWDDQRYYAFAAGPARVAIPAGSSPDKFEYDLETADSAFPMAMMGIRLLPADASVNCELGGDDKLAVACAAVSKALTAGQGAQVLMQERTIPVTEKPVMSRPVGGGGAAVEFVAGVNHGLIRFTSALSVKYLGKFPTLSADVQGDTP